MRPPHSPAARILRLGKELTLANFAETRPALLTTQELVPVVNDFVRRNVLAESHGQYEFVLPIFKRWLTELGISSLASDTVGEQLAKSAEAAEEFAFVQSSEIEKLTKSWPPYQGRFISSETVRAWLDQINRNRQRRLLFTLLESVKFFDEQTVRQRLKTAYGIIRPSLPQFVQKRRAQRRMDVAVTYVDGEGKSGQYYASKYSEENNISSQSIISPADFSAQLDDYQREHGKVAALVIVDDIVATGGSLVKNLENFAATNKKILAECHIPTNVVVLTSTVDGEAFVRAALEKIDGFDVDLRICEHLSERQFAFHASNGIWKTLDDFEEAKSLCIDLGTKIYGVDNPLGVGNKGLLVVFPDTCPNNTLPILHTSRSEGGFRWTALFPRLSN